MVEATTIGAVGALAALLAASAFFSSSETAIFAATDETLVDPDDDPDATALAALRADPHRLLVTLLVGNNVVNVAVSSITTLLLVEVLPPAQVAPVATVLVATVVLVCGEIVPKAYGLGNAAAWSLRVARPLTLVGWLLYPVVVVFDVVTRRLTALVGGDPAVERSLTEE